MQSVISVRDIEKIYHRGGGEVRALDRISMEVGEGEFLAIVGESGSGKSTLLNILGCLDSPDGGSYRLDGEDVGGFSSGRLARVRNHKIGFVFQGFNLLPELTALENVELPLLYRGVSRQERRRLAEDALSRVGLGDRVTHRPCEMSGGQQQRAAIARAIAAAPPVLLADEPTGNLDTKSGGAVMEILHALHREGRTIVLITHDNAVARQAQRIVRICGGKLAPAEDFVLNGLFEAR